MKESKSSQPKMSYTADEHQHRFAAWAASRAASVKGCRFTVKQGRNILEASGFRANFSRPQLLPAAKDTDKKHRWWRRHVIQAAKSQGLTFTDGVAAKLINCYLKSRFVCGGFHEHKKIQYLHPPIDAVLLKSLADTDFGEYAREWREARKTRWSNFDSERYEQVINLIRMSLKGKPLWMIEEHWKGNQ